MPTHIVKVREHDREVSTYQKSKTVWIATGLNIYGKSFSVEGRTESSAVRAWREAVDYHNE